MAETTPVVVVGAGAVGCFFGGMLARAGHPVVLVARPQHVDAIGRAGLRMEARGFDEHVHVRATTDIAAVAQARIVLFCVKSGDTEAAGAQLRPHLRPDAIVFCLQNGVDNAERLRTVLAPPQVAAAVVYVATEMAGPGHLKHHGRGDLVIEPSPRSEELARLFEHAAVPVEISTNVRGALWAKLVVNCAYNAVSAIAQRPYGENVRSPGIQQVMSDVVAECLSVASADGVEIPGDIDQAVRRIAEGMPTQFSSTAQDLARGKPTEIDHLNGLVVRRGQALGIPTPVNRALWALVKLVEGKQQRVA